MFDRPLPRCRGVGTQPQLCVGMVEERPDEVVGATIVGNDFVGYYLLRRVDGVWAVVERYDPPEFEEQGPPRPAWVD